MSLFIAFEFEVTSRNDLWFLKWGFYVWIGASSKWPWHFWWRIWANFGDQTAGWSPQNGEVLEENPLKKHLIQVEQSAGEVPFPPHTHAHKRKALDSGLRNYSSSLPRTMIKCTWISCTQERPRLKRKRTQTRRVTIFLRKQKTRHPQKIDQISFFSPFRGESLESFTFPVV